MSSAGNEPREIIHLTVDGSPTVGRFVVLSHLGKGDCHGFRQGEGQQGESLHHHHHHHGGGGVVVVSLIWPAKSCRRLTVSE